MKYRYKQTIDAVKWDGKNFSEIPKWLHICIETGVVTIMEDKVLLNLIDNTIAVNPNDYIIRFEDGSKDVLNEDLFNKYFEKVYVV